MLRNMLAFRYLAREPRYFRRNKSWTSCHPDGSPTGNPVLGRQKKAADGKQKARPEYRDRWTVSPEKNNAAPVTTGRNMQEPLRMTETCVTCCVLQLFYEFVKCTRKESSSSVVSSNGC